MCSTGMQITKKGAWSECSEGDHSGRITPCELGRNSFPLKCSAENVIKLMFHPFLTMLAPTAETYRRVKSFCTTSEKVLPASKQLEFFFGTFAALSRMLQPAVQKA